MSIEIPRELADAEGVPGDLDADEVTPYRFPGPSRRKTAAVIYLAGAGLAGLGAVVGLPTGLLGVALALILIAIYHLMAAWRVRIDEHQALSVAAREVSFEVGHASAAMRFDGFRARPTWNVIVYSGDDPPSRRGLVRVDATTGSLSADTYTEDIPRA